MIRMKRRTMVALMIQGQVNHPIVDNQCRADQVLSFVTQIRSDTDRWKCFFRGLLQVFQERFDILRTPHMMGLPKRDIHDKA